MQPKVLVADYDADFRSEVGKFLLQRNFQMFEADSLKEAEEIALRLKPDLAVVDMLAPDDESGFVLCYRLKKNFPTMPVIVISQVSSRTGITFTLDTDEEKRWLRADLILEKGSTADQLHKEILKLLRM
jgi:DNA-binding response OmpR family regulator